MQDFQASEKLSKLADFSKQKYDEADLLQHNWEHIIRNIYRSEKIAETEENVDLETLYAATMLHDIGVTIGEYKNHEENSRKVAKEELPNCGFSDEETKKIVEVLEAFAGKKEITMVEAKILSDADKLEKSSLAAAFNTFKVSKELDKNIQDMVENLSKYRKLQQEGFYTEKAEEMNNGGVQERIEFMEKFRERLKDREDFTASEKDLKIDI